MVRQKYIKTKSGKVIIFPCEIEHHLFKSMNPLSAGFCHISDSRISCFGESISLNLKANVDEDTKIANQQIFGIDSEEKQEEQ